MTRNDWRGGIDHGASGGGRFRSAMRRVFGDGENPLDWAIPLYSAWGIRVRIHLLFVVFIVVRLLFTLPQGTAGVLYIGMFLTALFVLVLLHEYGHCMACRMTGGDADDILLWPLGGLASCRPPHNWRADLVTTLGGPGVNLVLLPVFGAALWLTTGGLGAVFFNPLDPSGALSASVFTEIGTSGPAHQPFWLLTLWTLHYANLVLLLFNMLVPMYPLDAGRAVHAVLWSRMGFRRALWVSVHIGIGAAAVLAVVSIAANQVLLLAIALFGGLACFLERRRVKFLEHGGVPGVDEGVPGFVHLGPEAADDDEEPPAGPSRRELRRAEREQAEQREVDRILEKISRTGMDSLSGAERRTLQRATRRGRGA